MNNAFIVLIPIHNKHYYFVNKNVWGPLMGHTSVFLHHPIGPSHSKIEGVTSLKTRCVHAISTCGLRMCMLDGKQGRREGGARGGRCPPWTSKNFTNNDSTLHWNVLFAPLHKREKNFSIYCYMFQNSTALTNKLWDYYNSNIKLWVPSSND